MTTTFHDAHLDTLMKLKALAEKHGMRIRFGTYNNHKVEDDLSLLDDYVDKELSDILNEYYWDIIGGEIMMSEERLWFELYDPQPKEKNPKYHVMTYIKKNIAFRLEENWEGALETAKEDYGFKPDEEYEDEEDVDMETVEKIDKLIEFINDKQGDWQGIDFQDNKTEIYGFGVGINEKIKDHRVYRDGMALHYFTELVCKYLKEPMIHNNY